MLTERKKPLLFDYIGYLGILLPNLTQRPST